jgi:hypothetical protein
VKRRLPAVLAVLAALGVSTVGLSGCNVRFSPYAAVVNGSEISQGQMHAALSAIAGNSGYLCSIAASGTTHVAGAGQGSYSSAFSAEVLSILVQDKAVGQELARLKLQEPSSLSSAALAQVEAASTPASGCQGTGASVVAAFPTSYRRELVSFQLDEFALAAHLAGTTLTPAGLERFAARYPNEASAACVSVIVVNTKATAASLRRQLLAGASFAALAKAHSIDTQTAPSGGAVGCIPDSDFSAPLNADVAALSVGRVSEPISFSSAFLLLLVTQRRPESRTALVSSLLTKEQSALSALIDHLVRSAKIQVDPRYGSWNLTASIPRVQPNPAPLARFVPNPGANSGPVAPA